jgi:hypothetical protein
LEKRFEKTPKLQVFQLYSPNLEVIPLLIFPD